MPMRIMTLVVMATLVSACGSRPQPEPVADSAQGAVADEPAPSEGLSEAVVATNAIEAPQLAPGSVDDFEINVGDRVLFETDRYDLSPEARGILENQALWLNRYPQLSATISGHADERGTREYNLALGARRAAAVRNYLIALGVAPDRLKTVSYGKERPVDPRSIADAWAANRRGVTQVEGTHAARAN